MPDVPIILPSGYILVYGWGQEQSYSGIVPNDTRYKFGTVYQIWDGGQIFVYGGDPIMWKDGDEYVKLAYAGSPYTMIRARLVTKDILPP